MRTACFETVHASAATRCQSGGAGPQVNNLEQVTRDGVAGGGSLDSEVPCLGVGFQVRAVPVQWAPMRHG